MKNDLPQLICSVFDELDIRQLEIFAHHSIARRLQIMFDLCEFSRQLVIASERQRNPNIEDAELTRRVIVRMQMSNGN